MVKINYEVFTNTVLQTSIYNHVLNSTSQCKHNIIIINRLYSGKSMVKYPYVFKYLLINHYNTKLILVVAHGNIDTLSMMEMIVYTHSSNFTLLHLFYLSFSYYDCSETFIVGESYHIQLPFSLMKWSDLCPNYVSPTPLDSHGPIIL